MQGSGGSRSRAVVVTLVACLVVLGALGYAYSSVSISLSADQSSISSLGGEVQSLQSHASQAQTSPEVTLTTELTTTATTTLTTTVATTEIQPITTTAIVCPPTTTTGTGSQSSTTVEQITGCGGGSATRYPVNFAVTPAGAGMTTPSTSTTVTIQRQGILVQISVTANAGYSFTTWSATSSSITFGGSTCATTSAEIDGPGTIVANFAAQSGPAYVTQSCSAHGLYLQTVSCTLPSPVVQGQTILLETAVVPPTGIKDSLGDQFALLGQTSCPCSSTYMLQVYSATAAASGPDTVTVQGPGNYDGLVVHVIAGVTGFLGSSIGSGTSSNLGVPVFQPPLGSLVVGVALVNNTEGVFNSTDSAGSGFRLLTAGPSIADEDGISSGNATVSQFSLQQPEHWAEVTVVFSTAATTTTTTMDQSMAPRTSAGAGSLGMAVLFIFGAAPRLAPRRRSAARFGKTVLSDAPA